MGIMDSWDVTLLVVAGYLAVISLVRLMARRKNQVLEELHKQAERERHNKQAQAQARRKQTA